MPDIDKDLAARLARLQGLSTSSSGGHGTGVGLQERLDALSGHCSESAEKDFNNRLASLSAARDTPSSAEDLKTRLSRLATGSDAGSKSAAAAPGKRQYDVPENFSDEWEDLDDLLATALEGSQGSPSTGEPSLLRESDIDGKLSELDVLLRAEATRATLGGSAPVERAAATVDQAVEAFLGGGGAGGDGAGRGDQGMRGGSLNAEEGRLLQMVSDQVRLEGGGLINEASAPVQEKPGEMWLPVAPTGRPEISSPAAGANVGTGAADARLIAQQAMDEARLGLTSTSDGYKPASDNGKSASHRDGRQAAACPKDEALSSSWCCICTEDASLRCRPCERENGQDEPELFCARCFKETHRGDSEMEVHQPQALSRARQQEEDGRKGRRTWRRRK
ncbi:unnamed protein product [Ectocarpus sp. 12 AP-2014]